MRRILQHDASTRSAGDQIHWNRLKWFTLVIEASLSSNDSFYVYTVFLLTTICGVGVQASNMERALCWPRKGYIRNISKKNWEVHIRDWKYLSGWECGFAIQHCGFQPDGVEQLNCYFSTKKLATSVMLEPCWFHIWGATMGVRVCGGQSQWMDLPENHAVRDVKIKNGGLYPTESAFHPLYWWCSPIASEL